MTIPLGKGTKNKPRLKRCVHITGKVVDRLACSIPASHPIAIDGRTGYELMTSPQLTSYTIAK